MEPNYLKYNALLLKAAHKEKLSAEEKLEYVNWMYFFEEYESEKMLWKIDF